MLRRLKGSWILAVALVGALASLAPACGSATDDGGKLAAVCAPNATQTCACPGGVQGVQTCNGDGVAFSTCDCGSSSTSSSSGGGSEVCGNGKVEGAEVCDDGNMVAGDGCEPNCVASNTTCGNGVPDPGECGEVGDCQKDCGNCGNMVEDAGECGPGGNCPIDCDPCKGSLTFAGLTTQGASESFWDYAGLSGVDAGNAMCKQKGADHVCTHAELRKAEKSIIDGKNELAGVAAGTSIWLHRENTDMVDVGGKMTPGGAGARCNEWKYKTNHISDGEYCTFDGTGVLTCFYDNDPTFDQANPKSQPGVLECGNTMREIPCCYEACVAP